MGYFSNGTEAMMYEDRYCDYCVHNHEEHGCPVWHAHKLWQGDKGTELLDLMIPRSEHGVYNEECAFFVDTREATPEPCDHAWRPAIALRFEYCAKCGAQRVVGENAGKDAADGM